MSRELDIVERLRAHSGAASGGWIMKDAADEIERLRTDYSLLSDDYLQLQAEIERLRAENAELRKSLATWVAVHS